MNYGTITNRYNKLIILILTFTHCTITSIYRSGSAMALFYHLPSGNLPDELEITRLARTISVSLEAAGHNHHTPVVPNAFLSMRKSPMTVLTLWIMTTSQKSFKAQESTMLDSMEALATTVQLPVEGGRILTHMIMDEDKDLTKTEDKLQGTVNI